ncbi:MAG: single-stranded DNA-binding protein [Muribaculaceae bacterium]|nr:single-stranded DNA-binding protein [Muribaculaceae bacterium]
MSYQKVILIGNACKDPELRYVEKRAIATFSLATDETFANPSGGEPIKRVEFHRIVMWDARAEFAEKYIRKGSKLFIEGRLRTRTWEDRSTIKHTVTEIVTDKLELLSRPS